MIRFWLFAAVASSLMASPVYAGILSEGAVRTTLPGGSFTAICQDGGSGIADADVSCSDAENSGRGRAQAAYGTLKAYAELSSPIGIDFNDDYQAFGRARFDDILTLNSPFLVEGLPADVTVYFDLTGTIFNDPPAFNELGDQFVSATLTVKVNGTRIEPGFGGGTAVPYYFRMYTGSPALFSAELVADVRCFGCDVPYAGIVDYFSTATLTAVEVGILAPTQFTVFSADGQSYANVVPVPEPGASVSALIALGTLGFIKRDRSRSSRSKS